MNYTARQISDILDATLLNEAVRPLPLTHIIFDSRKISLANEGLFVAIRSDRDNGHNYIKQAYDQGVRNFLVDISIDSSQYKDAQFIITSYSTLHALQRLAGHYRQSLEYPIIAITGSNGKTIVKEWLAQALTHCDHSISKTPKSYNSQLGVTISLLLCQPHADYGIIEAGISTVQEMQTLENIIKPTVGIFTMIGDAHNTGFGSIEEKINEKLYLFRQCTSIIYCADQDLAHHRLKSNTRTFSWGRNPESHLIIEQLINAENHTTILLASGKSKYIFDIPFVSDIYLENAMHVIATLIHLGKNQETIQQAVSEFSEIENRLEIIVGLHNTLVINDSYSLDVSSTAYALELQEHYSNNSKVCFISRAASQENSDSKDQRIKTLISDKKLDHLVAIGYQKDFFSGLNIPHIQYYDNTDQCLTDFKFSDIRDAVVLIKGARQFRMERIAQKFDIQRHSTILETNLTAIDFNINTYKTYLMPTTKIMAVIKASGYGSGSHHFYKHLESRKIDYLAVALIDEAVELRIKGCQLPIMIFNPQLSHLDSLWIHNLEPEIFSLSQLKSLITHAQSRPLKIHIKIDSGMHRLGFDRDELSDLIQLLKQHKYLEVTSIFSHLAGSEDVRMDENSLSQIKNFNEAYTILESSLEYSPFKHILNTAGIVRFSEYQFDMVRLGIGLYGIDESKLLGPEKLKPANKLSARIIHINTVRKGQSTGYGNAGIVSKDSTIGIVGIGYADGLMRAAGNGRHNLKIKNRLYPILGNVCMDVCMVDITDSIGIKVGDEVIIFDHDHSIDHLANACNTISYEILSRIAPRVKRIFIH